nr:hypothetical protein [Tanacetum cinerariifolium]
RIPGSVALIREYEPSTKTPTRGGGILYEGTWTSATGQTKPAVWAADLLTYHGPQILSDFVVGGRMLDVNPNACQSNAPATAATSTQQTMPAAASLVNISDSTAAVLALVRQVDLAPAWDGSAEAAMEGFYGPDNYRISFHFDSVRRDAQHPNTYHFQGRDRYKKTITSFTGTLTVTRLAALPDTFDIMPSQVEGAYTAYADFVLRESTAARGAGSCRGRALLDFVVVKGQAQQAGFGSIDAGHDNPTKSCGLVFKARPASRRPPKILSPPQWSQPLPIPPRLAQLLKRCCRCLRSLAAPIR